MFYRVDRLSRAHRVFRDVAYAALYPIPDSLKYTAGGIWRHFRLPYRLLKRGDTVVQVGAPWDTLRSGRSRAVHFGRIVGMKGRVYAVEPAEASVDELTSFIDRHSLQQIVVIPIGAWDTRARLRFLTNPNHPASNLIAEVFDPDRERGEFEESYVEVDSLDNLLDGDATASITLLSITTNGSELKILKGATKVLARTLYVSTITPAVGKFLSMLGFSPFGEDDRGFMFRNDHLT